MILVTGGAGFIGSHLVDELMVQGHEVRVLDNLSEGRIENLDRWHYDPKFTFVKGDIRDLDLVRRCVDGCSIVFHLAACSRIQPSITDPMIAFTQNYIGSANVAEASRQAGVKRVVYSASSSAYGRMNDWACEEYDHPLAGKGKGLFEELDTEFLNPYSLSKHGGEEIMQLYHELYGLSTVALRYFNVYGPRHQEEGSYATVIAIWRKQMRHGKPLTIVGDGTQRRDFTFVSDVVRANMLAAFNWEATGVFNVGTGKNYSINELAELVAPGQPIMNIPPRKGEAVVTLADINKIKNVLGWEPFIQVPEGLLVIDEYEKRMGNQSGIVTVGR